MSSLILHPGQSEVFGDLFVRKTISHAVAVCSRGWGKSHLAAVAGITAVNELMQLPADVPNKNVFIIAPTYAQVTDIYHPLIVYQLGMEYYCVRHSKDLGRIWFPNNVELRLVSYEAVERMRGMGAYFVVNDEVRDWTKGSGFKEAWEGIIQPCIATRWGAKRAQEVGAPAAGRSLTISTPKGYDFLYEMSNKQDLDPSYKTYIYDYTTSPMLDPEEIEKVRHTIDPLRFNREYKATFEGSGNSVFYCFNRKEHVRRDLPDFRKAEITDKFAIKSMGEDIHIGIDFNVGIQASCAFAVRGGQIHVLDEFKGHPDTEQLAIAIQGRYWPHYNDDTHPLYKKKTCKITVYPDPTGNSRKTSAAVGTTDFSILASHGFIVQAHRKSPPIVDSVNAVNRMFKTAAGETHMWVSSKCQGLANSLEHTVWVENNPDTATIDKKAGEEHFSDSLRYPTEFLFPIRLGTKAVARGFNF
jgi:hypothetical protein